MAGGTPQAARDPPWAPDLGTEAVSGLWTPGGAAEAGEGGTQGGVRPVSERPGQLRSPPHLWSGAQR